MGQLVNPSNYFKMDKNYLIQLTNELYRLTLLFPKKEPLRYKMREVADDILANTLRIINFYEWAKRTLFSSSPSLPAEARYTNNKSNPSEGDPLQILGDLEVLDSFFEVAKVQNWVSPNDVLRLQEEYSKLNEELKAKIAQIEKYKPLKELSLFPAKEEEQQKILETELPSPNKVPERELGGQALRQEKILEFLREKGRAQVWEIKEIFPQVSKRTLRRDFEQLLERGLVERIGERNDTFYQLKRRTEEL